MSLSELKQQATTIKSMNALKALFVRLTNTGSWESAEQFFPQFTTESQLSRFVGCKKKKCIPKSLKDFCQRAKASSANVMSVQAESVFTFNTEGGPPMIAM